MAESGKPTRFTVSGPDLRMNEVIMMAFIGSKTSLNLNETSNEMKKLIQLI